MWKETKDVIIVNTSVHTWFLKGTAYQYFSDPVLGHSVEGRHSQLLCSESVFFSPIEALFTVD